MWLERQALHDPLTKLPNRTLLMDRARQALTRLHRSHGVLAMLFVDLDKFKAVNDNLGHDVGDRLLVSVSERLAELMRDSDTIARLGGDEFVILAEELESEDEAMALGRARARRARGARSRSARAEVAMLASVGVVGIAQTPTTDPEAMLREADLAMYKAKGAGGRRLELFDDSLRRRAEHASVELEGRLRDALPRQELMLAYQPILPLAGGQAVGMRGARALAPAGATAPGEELLPSTLPAARRGQRADRADRQLGAAHGAARRPSAWRRAGIAIPVSVNVSARELTELDLAERVREELAYCRLPGPRAVHRGQRGGGACATPSGPARR